MYRFHFIADDLQAGGKVYGKRGLSFTRGVSGLFKFMLPRTGMMSVSNKSSDMLHSASSKVQHTVQSATSSASHIIGTGEQHVANAVNKS